MAVFGEHWVNHAEKISGAWRALVGNEDIVLVPGDVSWAMKLNDAVPDLAFLAGLPGRKVLVRGNHDYWWSSAAKVRAVLPESMYILHNDGLLLEGVAFAGTRLWVDPEMSPPVLPLRIPPDGKAFLSGKMGTIRNHELEDPERDRKIFHRELNRLSLSLSCLSAEAELKIALLHFPPLSTDLEGTRTTDLLEEAGVHHCVFGHLHNLAPTPGRSFYGQRRGVSYHLTSCDYLDFVPDLVAKI
jgi:predicted phosphohydrolase